MSGTEGTSIPGSGQGTPGVDGEAELVEQLTRGDEAAFKELVSRYHVAMVRLARSFVATNEAAEDVAQQTWLAVVEGIERFEGRSKVKTWLFRILINCAKTHGIRESRSTPFSSLRNDKAPSLVPERLLTTGRPFGGPDPTYQARKTSPELRTIDAETRRQIKLALDALPPAQRAVVRLRDVHGLSPAEVCDALGVTEVNQRVLLHRGRSKMRAVLNNDLSEMAVAG